MNILVSIECYSIGLFYFSRKCCCIKENSKYVCSQNVFHIFHKILSQLWKNIFDHFINKAWTHAGASHSEALDLTMGLWTPVSMATVANSSFQSWWQFSPMAWISYKTKYSQRPFWANSLAANLLIGNNLQLIHTFQGSSVFS